MGATRSRRFAWLLAVLAAMALLAAACSNDDDDSEAEEETTTSAGDTTTSTEDDTSTSADDTTTSTEDDSEDETAGAIGIELGEWFVDPSGEISAGTVTFAIENVGENPHAFAIARGNSYDDLPQKSNGAVDTDALGDEFLGRIDNIESGQSGEIEFELEAGNYVFFCPIEFGPNSHAANGQVLSVTVSG